MSMNRTCPISNFSSDADSEITPLFLFAQLLETRIFTQWIPERIEAKNPRCKSGGHFEKVRKSGDRCIDIAYLSFDLRQYDFRRWLVYRIISVVSHCLSRFGERLLFLSKAGVSQSKRAGQQRAIHRNNRRRRRFDCLDRKRISGTRFSGFTRQLLTMTQKREIRHFPFVEGLARL